jgi:putative glutamine amidotransferase
MQPLIGITTSIQLREDGLAENHTSFAPNAAAIERAGGLPVLIPTGLDAATLRAIYDRMDGIFVPGGGDVNPECYGAPQHPLTDRIVDARDTLEISLVQWSAADDVPLLGVCRGNQVINVALGGTLIQDIPSQLESEINHRFRPEGVAYPQDGHTIDIEPGSHLAEIIGTTTNVTVNTLHHQSVEKLAPGLIITAHAPDGVVEGLEMRGKHFLIGVQWHPEIMPDNEQMQRLFIAFVAAARENMLNKADKTAVV